MSNQIKDESAFGKVIRRCIKKKWFVFTYTDLSKGLIYEIRITNIKPISKYEGERR